MLGDRYFSYATDKKMITFQESAKYWNLNVTIYIDTSSKKNKVGKGRERNSTLNLPLSIMLSNEDLSTELNELLKKAVLKRAKKDKLPIGRLLTRAQIKWNLECKLGE